MTDMATNGRIVHVNDIVAKCQPLLVSNCNGDRVSGLLVRPTGSAGPATMVPFSEEPYDPTIAQVSWHWPER